jgi:hypothetical protein
MKPKVNEHVSDLSLLFSELEWNLISCRRDGGILCHFTDGLADSRDHGFAVG